MRHQVTAFVRSPEGMQLGSERVNVIKGNAMDEDQLANAMRNHDAVISTLAPRHVFKPTSMLHESAVATSHAMQRCDIKRLVVLSAAAHFPGISNRIASFIMRNHMRDSLLWNRSYKVTDSIGRSRGLRVSLRKII